MDQGEADVVFLQNSVSETSSLLTFEFIMSKDNQCGYLGFDKAGKPLQPKKTNPSNEEAYFMVQDCKL